MTRWHFLVLGHVKISNQIRYCFTTYVGIGGGEVIGCTCDVMLIVLSLQPNQPGVTQSFVVVAVGMLLEDVVLVVVMLSLSRQPNLLSINIYPWKQVQQRSQLSKRQRMDGDESSDAMGLLTSLVSCRSTST